MEVRMEVNRKHAEIAIAMSLNVSLDVTKGMTDEELAEKIFRFVRCFGLTNGKLVKGDQDD